MEKESSLLVGIQADRKWIEALAKFAKVHPADAVILAIEPFCTAGSYSMCAIRRNSPRSKRRARSTDRRRSAARGSANSPETARSASSAVPRNAPYHATCILL
jgi:hypothetical protein